VSPPRAYDTFVVDGLRLRRDPAREPCFRVARGHSDVYVEAPVALGEGASREELHRHVNNEVLSLEVAAQTIVDFPDAPWELRLELARQCWDETRHARLCLERLREIGGRKGEFPIINHEWNVTCALDSMAARLAVQNRTFEAGSLDVLQQVITYWEQQGDRRTAEIMEAILADEINHVRFGNLWLRRFTKEDPRNVLKVAEAMTFLKQVMEALSTRPGEVFIEGTDLATLRHEIPTQWQERADAGFTARELTELRRQEQAQPLPRRAPRDD
jgi:uncharacterized ferritin-like protein (DUF455 family)